MTCGCKIVTGPVTVNQMMNESHPERQINFCPLHTAAPAMREALTDIFAMIENGELVRDIKKDGEPNWTIKMLGFVTRLQKAHSALALAEPEKKL